MPHPVPDPAKDPVDRLIELMALLRSPGGCPWDREQTHVTLRPGLIEETYEVIDAIDAWGGTGDSSHLREELGDLLFHLVFHARLAEERGDFTFRDTASDVVEKLIRRHPHVFGDASAGDTAAVLRNWDQIKKAEKPERTGTLDGVPLHLPALMRAQEVQKKAAKVGFDWPDADGPREKIAEELREIVDALAEGASKDKIADEAGDLLFSVVNYLRHLKVDSETALAGATRKFEGRFRAVEAAAATAGKPLAKASHTIEELEELWQNHKATEAG
ncbi:tetrapyrrole methylase family protein / MazG family protein/ATP diphosphatase [Verrucomicrobium sp. GAS474]|uniref:nucleoside triphosphate pyrophosphohydrolase n=1 Tax=Verrucomicrobium sp. GAS474 TaxID=1882831 RepID=UPI00087C9369|nr:nucleoside triphosphate pyrophosphohydrolase [Verrucomicrobium sp. GAS474]SDU08802.1 tetrapyrrole methylase family protein / MazG family protein/ATP diphosphatase [Verrucomicrobium sp. GAS474]